MNRKLTLNIDREAIDRGKKFAARNGTSLSHMLEAFLFQLDAGGNE